MMYNILIAVLLIDFVFVVSLMICVIRDCNDLKNEKLRNH